MPRIFVEAWDPDYGASFPTGELSPSAAEVDPEVERPRRSWAPMRPEGATPTAEKVLFVDGVRRIDALVWVTSDDGSTRMGLCASYAAGVVEAAERAEISRIAVRRSLFTNIPGVPALETEAGVYSSSTGTGENLAQLTLELQDRLRLLEVEVAGEVPDGGLLVVDGPLTAHHPRARALGYVKSHRVSYLDDALEKVVRSLQPGERTPLFLTTTSWSRYSFYLRLESEKSHPWSGVVRLEVAAEVKAEEAVELANVAAVTLPRYSSVPHKDPRAPQNLFPIGGLERELRRRLGDEAVVYRALKLAAAGTA